MDRKEFLKQSGLLSAGLLTGQAEGALQTKIAGKELIKPKALRPGDTVALSAPAGILPDFSEFDRMQKDLESFGFNVVFGEFVRSRYGYLAGRDYERALDLNRFFANPEIDGIIAVRGGWGCSRILPYLDFELIRSNPKVYCGFSDNTTLHLALLAYSGLISFHGPNGSSEWNPYTKNSFKEVLIDGHKAVFHSESSVKTINGGRVSGHLVGGNLTILTTSLGTPYQPDFSGAILYLEDIGEAPYKIDRMLTHLSRAGALQKINGLIFGKCTDCGSSNTRGFNLYQVLQQHISPLDIPAISGVDIGHESNNMTIPAGVSAELDADAGSFSLTEPAVLIA